MPIYGTPNFLAYFGLAMWVPLSLALYWRLRPSAATAITIVLGRLFSPERIGLALPIFPDLTKQTVTVLGAFLGWLFTARHQLAQAKPLRGIDLWILPILIGDIDTRVTNSDLSLPAPLRRVSSVTAWPCRSTRTWSSFGTRVASIGAMMHSPNRACGVHPSSIR